MNKIQFFLKICTFMFFVSEDYQEAKNLNSTFTQGVGRFPHNRIIIVFFLSLKSQIFALEDLQGKICSSRIERLYELNLMFKL